MRRYILAAAALAAFAITATSADAYYGPRKVGDQCWRTTSHQDFGYWEQCKEPAATAQAAAASRPQARKPKR